LKAKPAPQKHQQTQHICPAAKLAVHVTTWLAVTGHAGANGAKKHRLGRGAERVGDEVRLARSPRLERQSPRAEQRVRAWPVVSQVSTSPTRLVGHRHGHIDWRKMVGDGACQLRCWERTRTTRARPS
jgi:hypothetical protein